MNAREVALHVDRDEPVAVRAARGLREHERTLSVDCVVAVYVAILSSREVISLSNTRYSKASFLR